MFVRGGGFGDEGIPVARPASVTACGRFDARVYVCWPVLTVTSLCGSRAMRGEACCNFFRLVPPSPFFGSASVALRRAVWWGAGGAKVKAGGLDSQRTAAAVALHSAAFSMGATI